MIACKVIAMTPPPAKAVISPLMAFGASFITINATAEDSTQRTTTPSHINRIFVLDIPLRFSPAPLASPSGMLATATARITEALTSGFSRNEMPILIDSGIPSNAAPITSAIEVFRSFR